MRPVVARTAAHAPQGLLALVAPESVENRDSLRERDRLPLVLYSLASGASDSPCDTDRMRPTRLLTTLGCGLAMNRYTACVLPSIAHSAAVRTYRMRACAPSMAVISCNCQ